jgi:uncharacterized protein (DUF4415 family)
MRQVLLRAATSEAGIALEDRFILLGFSARLRLLLVCHCYREGDDVIRIISARKAERSEREQYHARWRQRYDFSKARRNPYAKRLKRQVTIRIDEQTIAYFQELPRELSIPYQTLINLYLRDCATMRKRLAVQWKPAV